MKNVSELLKELRSKSKPLTLDAPRLNRKEKAERDVETSQREYDALTQAIEGPKPLRFLCCRERRGKDQRECPNRHEPRANCRNSHGSKRTDDYRGDCQSSGDRTATPFIKRVQRHLRTSGHESL